MGGDLTRAADASRGALSAVEVVDPDVIAAVAAAVPDVLRPGTAAEERSLRLLIAQRLANGWTVEALIERGEQSGRAAQQRANRGDPVLSPVGWWATAVKEHPPAPPLSAVEHCGDPECDPYSHMREDQNGRWHRCWRCHPLLVGGGALASVSP